MDRESSSVDDEGNELDDNAVDRDTSPGAKASPRGSVGFQWGSNNELLRYHHKRRQRNLYRERLIFWVTRYGKIPIYTVRLG